MRQPRLTRSHNARNPYVHSSNYDVYTLCATTGARQLNYFLMLMLHLIEMCPH